MKRKHLADEDVTIMLFVHIGSMVRLFYFSLEKKKASKPKSHIKGYLNIKGI